MEKANRLQQALKSGKTSFGAWQGLPGTNFSRILARTPYLDWICLDCEHGQLSDNEMHESVAAIAACGISPLVRIPEGQHHIIKRALDAGAHGIVVPMVHDVEEAKRIVTASKFPPQGTRGLGSGLSMEKFNPGITGQIQEVSLTDYYRDANSSTLVIAQVELKSALEQVEDIAKVEGIDVLFVGPMDLSNSIGHSIALTGSQSPEVVDAIERIRMAAKEGGKFSGFWTASGEQSRKYAQQGFQMVNVVNDINLIKSAMAEQLKVAAGE